MNCCLILTTSNLLVYVHAVAHDHELSSVKLTGAQVRSKLRTRGLDTSVYGFGQGRDLR